MTAPTEVLTAVPEAAPSLFWASVRMVLLLAVFLAAAWFLFRWHRRNRGSAKSLEVLDRAFLARGTSVALLRVEGRRLLLGVSAEGVRLLRDMDAGGPPPSDAARFGRALHEASAAKEAGS